MNRTCFSNRSGFVQIQGVRLRRIREKCGLKLVLSFSLALLFAAGISGCGCTQSKSVLLATTTSAYDTGLLDEIQKVFTEKTGYRLKIVAVGTGEALRMGREKAVDVLLIHAKTDEEKFVEEGCGVERVEVMHNDFVILGPVSNPAGIEMEQPAAGAFGKIAAAKSAFVARGDNSGTHKKEKSIWEKTGTAPKGAWYIETGQGMGASLKIADEKQAYIISDRGTFYSLEDKLDLKILNSGSKELINYYSVIEVTPGKKWAVNTVGARAFRNFIVSEECQKLIGNFRKNNKQLFYPDAK